MVKLSAFRVEFSVARLSEHWSWCDQRFLPQLAEKRAREEQVKRSEEAEAKMSSQVTALNENVATLKREVQASQRRVGELEKQTDELRGEIAVLEATVQNNQDERRALLERSVHKLLLGFFPPVVC